MNRRRFDGILPSAVGSTAVIPTIVIDNGF
jgi:hypothetical protein